MRADFWNRAPLTACEERSQKAQDLRDFSGSRAFARISATHDGEYCIGIRFLESDVFWALCRRLRFGRCGAGADCGLGLCRDRRFRPEPYSRAAMTRCADDCFPCLSVLLEDGVAEGIAAHLVRDRFVRSCPKGRGTWTSTQQHVAEPLSATHPTMHAWVTDGACNAVRF